MTFRPDRAGMVALMQSAEVQAAVDAAAEAVRSSAASSTRFPVTTDRFKAPFGDGRGVTIAHAAGIAVEAKHGVLIAATRSVGLRPGKSRRLRRSAK